MRPFLLIFLLFISVPQFITSADKKKDKKTSKPEKAEKKLDLIDRIKLVLKYGNTTQVKDSLAKIKSLKEDQQKSLIPELRNLITSTKDSGIQLALIQLVGDAPWNDLDSQLIQFLKSDDSILLTTSANILRRKNVKGAIEPLKELLLKADYTIEDRNLNDLINAYAGFKDPGLQDFMFNKLKDEKVLDVYKSFILKYLGMIPAVADSVKAYLLNLSTDEKQELRVRIGAVRALGNMSYDGAREPFRKLLEGIENLSDREKKKELFFLRLELISALVKLKDENVKSLLIEMTRDDDETVRIRAIRKLSGFKSREFIDLLEYKARYDNSLAVQKEARKALDIIQGKQDATEE